MRVTNQSEHWRDQKNEGRDHFNEGRFEEALSSFRKALAPGAGCPQCERQILLSNVVACRLKLGSPAHTDAALEEARQCVAENDRWAKGHVRLASVFAVLGRSNDACNSLQRALQLDPSNQTARRMLTQELRRGTPSTSGNDRGSNSTQQEQTPSAPPPPSDSTNDHVDRNEPNPYDQRTRPDDVRMDDNDIDDTTFAQRAQFKFLHISNWYANQSDDVKSAIKVIFGLVILYIAFGGRFGLNSFKRDMSTAGDYGRGNVYDEYHDRTSRNLNREEPGRSRYSRDYDTRDYYSESHQRRQSRSRSSSFHLPDLFDGSLPSMLCLAAFLFACHKFGVNPFQALWMLNMMNGGRRQGMGMGHGGMRMGRGFGRRY